MSRHQKLDDEIWITGNAFKFSNSPVAPKIRQTRRQSMMPKKAPVTRNTPILTRRQSFYAIRRNKTDLSLPCVSPSVSHRTRNKSELPLTTNKKKSEAASSSSTTKTTTVRSKQKPLPKAKSEVIETIKNETSSLPKFNKSPIVSVTRLAMRDVLAKGNNVHELNVRNESKDLPKSTNSTVTVTVNKNTFYRSPIATRRYQSRRKSMVKIMENKISPGIASTEPTVKKENQKLRVSPKTQKETKKNLSKEEKRENSKTKTKPQSILKRSSKVSHPKKVESKEETNSLSLHQIKSKAGKKENKPIPTVKNKTLSLGKTRLKKPMKRLSTTATPSPQVKNIRMTRSTAKKNKKRVQLSLSTTEENSSPNLGSSEVYRKTPLPQPDSRQNELLNSGRRTASVPRRRLNPFTPKPDKPSEMLKQSMKEHVAAEMKAQTKESVSNSLVDSIKDTNKTLKPPMSTPTSKTPLRNGGSDSSDSFCSLPVTPLSSRKSKLSARFRDSTTWRRIESPEERVNLSTLRWDDSLNKSRNKRIKIGNSPVLEVTSAATLAKENDLSYCSLKDCEEMSNISVKEIESFNNHCSFNIAKNDDFSAQEKSDKNNRWNCVIM